MYGTATWNGFRLQSNAKGYLSLSRVIETAKQAGGNAHHFRAIQLPYNLAMTEAFTYANQSWENETVSALECASRAGLLVFTSASLLQGRLAQQMPEQVRSFFLNLTHDSARALQFVRSTPGVTTALCGMKSVGHITENLSLTEAAPLSEQEFMNLFVKPA